MLTIGIDVGGTFTDIVVVDSDAEAVLAAKVPSRAAGEGEAVLDGLRDLAIDPADATRLVHGTTVGTNAVLQKQGVRVAFVTTRGFRDILEIGRQKRFVPALFNPRYVRPKPLVPRARCFEVRERLHPDGTVLEPLAVAELGSLADALRSQGIEAIAVCFLHSYANKAHERAAADALAQLLPGVPVSLSAEVVPEYREFERFSTTVLNAYIQPVVGRYLDRLDAALAGAGFRKGVLTLASSGGAMSVETTKRFPVNTILSGPAGGVVAGTALARDTGLTSFITYDMGGTSTDVCLVRDLMPTFSTDNLLEAFPVKVLQVEMNTVGAGGGSIATIGEDGSLEVGPESAGAVPGPVAYGQGGDKLTVTDANFYLNRLRAPRLLGGRVPLRKDLTRAAVDAMAAKLGLAPEQCAEGIIRISVTKMAHSVRAISIQRGHDPRDFALIAFGGAGPMHAAAIAEELSIPAVVVPRFPGNFSAMGLLASDIKHDYVRTCLLPLEEATRPVIERVLGELGAEARAQLAKDGFERDVRLVPSVDLRYAKQAFELNVAMSPGPLSIRDLRAAFDAKHHATYGHSDPGGRVTLVNLRLTGYGEVPKPRLKFRPPPGATAAAAVVVEEPVYFDGRFVACRSYDRDRLPIDADLSGPAIVEEFGSTTVVPPAWHCRVDEAGNLVLTRGARPNRSERRRP
jgi:N-methylhydantoinase A